MSRQLLFFVILVFFGIPVYAQSGGNTIIHIDTLAIPLNAAKPIDSSFTLKYPVGKSAKIVSASLFEVKNDGCLKNVVNNCCRLQQLEDNSPREFYDLYKYEKKIRQKIKTDPDFHLKPYFESLIPLDSMALYIDLWNQMKAAADALIQGNNAPALAVGPAALFYQDCDTKYTNRLGHPQLWNQADFAKYVSKRMDSISMVSLFTFTGNPALMTALDAHQKYHPVFNAQIRASGTLLEKRLDSLDAISNIIPLIIRDYMKEKSDDPFNGKYVEHVHSAPLGYTQDTSGTAYIKIFPLAPNKRYFLILNTLKKVDQIEAVVGYLDAGQIMAAKSKYESLTKKGLSIRTIYPNVCGSCDAEEFKLGSFATFMSYYNGHVRSVEEVLRDRQQSLQMVKIPAVAGPQHVTLDKTLIGQVINRAQECLKCKDTLWEYQLVATDKNLFADLLNLSRLSDTLIYQGYARLDSLDYGLNYDTIRIPKKVTNLAATIRLIRQFAGLLQYLDDKYTFTGNNYQTVQQGLAATLETLRANYEQLYRYQVLTDSLNNQIRQLKDSSTNMVNAFPGFLAPYAVVMTSSFSYDFTTRTGYAIKPDFGFLGYGNPWNNPGFAGVSPYLGFHVNFRPYNTNIPWHKIQKRWPYDYLSFTAGALLVSLADSGRTKGLVGRTSVFTGLGYALGHAVRINFGSVWFTKINPNPLKTSTSVAATPYIGLSLDLRLKDIYNSFVNIFP